MMLNMSESTIPEPEVKWIHIRDPLFFRGPISQGAAAQPPSAIDIDCLIGCVSQRLGTRLVVGDDLATTNKEGELVSEHSASLAEHPAERRDTRKNDVLRLVEFSNSF
jgi:hypothetical protein